MDFDDDDDEEEGGEAEGEEDHGDNQVETVPHAPFIVVVSKKVCAHLGNARLGRRTS